MQRLIAHRSIRGRRPLALAAAAIAAVAGGASYLLASQASGKATEAPPAAAARILYVSPSGSDSAACTREAPCASFDRGYHAAEPGEVVAVGPGTYPAQTITPDATKTSQADVVFRPAPGTRPVVKGDLAVTASHLTIRGLKIVKLFVGWGSSPRDDTFEDLDGETFYVGGGASFITIRGGDWGPSTCGPENSDNCVSKIAPDLGADGILPHDITIDGAYFHDYQTPSSQWHDTCIFLTSGWNITIENSKFRNCSTQDVFLQDWPGYGLHDVTIQNNWFGQPHDHGVPQPTCAVAFSGRNNIVWTNFLVRYNTILGCLDVGDGETAGWRNTHVIANIGAYVACHADRGLSWRNNLWLSAPCGPTDRKVRDLGLVGAARFDYHLRANSPAIGAGDRASLPATDIDGVARPRSAPDAGADER